jgi:fimbrial chaperone protein
MRLLSLLLFCLIGFSSSALASALSISPLRVDLSVEQPIATLNVSNQGATSTTLQAHLMQWTQNKGEDVYTKTKDMLVTPPIFTIAPSQKQVIRVATRAPAANPKQEQAYRLYLKELPHPVAAGFNGITVLTEIALPVFIAPLVPPVVSLRWTAKPVADNNIRLRLNNAGNIHAKITHLTIHASGTKKSMFDKDLLNYILPNQFQEWTIPGTARALHLVASMENGEKSSWDVAVE